jgi:uncharacterized protein involved in exopolysaccharide biosynthesis
MANRVKPRVSTELDGEWTPSAAPERLGLVPAVAVGPATRSHPWLVGFCVVVLAAAGIAAGYERSPTYHAQTRLAVGRLDGAAPASLSGFAVATQAMAEKYSREVRGDAVVADVARELDASPAAIRSHIAAAPIPQTPVFRIIANDASPERAIMLANAFSDSLAARAARESSATPQSARLLRAYRHASARLEAQRAKVESSRRRYLRNRTNARRALLGEARAQAAAEELQVRGLAADYEASRHPQGTAALVQVLEHATAAGSDRDRMMQLLGFAGAVAGLVIGLALALWRSRRAARRSIG